MKNLYLFTDGYPYTNGEKTFINSEIEVLSKNFNLIVIACVDESRIVNDSVELPNNVKAICLTSALSYIDKIKVIKCFFDASWWHEIIKAFRCKDRVIRRIVYSMYYYSMALHYKALINKNEDILLIDDSLCYTFWNTHYTYALAMLKKEGADINIVSRAHRYDLYSGEEYGVLCQPYKTFVDKYIDYLFFISEEGKKYYLDHYAVGTESNKYQVKYLGASSIGPRYYRNLNIGQVFIIVSCSNIIPIKRVQLIVDVLKKIDTAINVKWVHFGGGAGFDSLAEKCERFLGGLKNISYELKGNTDNRMILDYYANEPVDAFLTTSSSEGLPVSILEALSYGIPVIAPSINGIPEAIIDGYNGYLTDSNHVVEDSIAAIERLASLSAEKVDNMHENAYYIWSEKFNADKNAQELCEQLLSL